ncbi:hypothetical protein [Streptomyces sp. NPDC004682]
MKGITFPAWRGKHYVTLAELLVRLGGSGLDLTWRVACDEMVDPRCAEIERRSAGGEPVVVLTEVDSSWWEVRSVDERVLGELRRHYPGATELP